LPFDFQETVSGKMDYEISHEGIVQYTGKDSVMVLLSPGVSCSGCQAEKSCNISGNDRKLIKVDGAFNLSSGEKVLVSMKKSQGYSAILLGYLIPLIVVIITLTAMISLSVNELFSGLISLGLLIPYYFLLFVLRKSISNRFTFTINRII